MSLLEIDRLRRSFGGVLAADDVDLALEAGERRCLVGPNGAGKSTLFKLIMGLVRPDAGRIRFGGEDITRMQPFRRAMLGLSMKYQTTRVFTNLTVGQNIYVARRQAAATSDAIDWGLDHLGLRPLWDHRAGILSYGQQHWLEMCMALGNKPRRVLMDEPTAGMTPEESRRTADFIRQLAPLGIAALVIEHDMGFVRELDAPVTVLHQGRIFRQGDIAAIERDADVQRIYLGESDG